MGEAKRKAVGNCFSVVHLAMQFELQLPADLAAFHTPLPTADSTKRIHTHKMWPAAAAAEGSGRRSERGGEGEEVQRGGGSWAAFPSATIFCVPRRAFFFG